MGVLTKKETLPFSKQFFSVEGPASADHTWNLEGNASLSQKELDPLYQLKLDKGLLNVPVLSFLLIRASERARKKGDEDQAIQAAPMPSSFRLTYPNPIMSWHETSGIKTPSSSIKPFQRCLKE